MQTKVPEGGWGVYGKGRRVKQILVKATIDHIGIEARDDEHVLNAYWKGVQLVWVVLLQIKNVVREQSLQIIVGC